MTLRIYIPVSWSELANKSLSWLDLASSWAVPDSAINCSTNCICCSYGEIDFLAENIFLMVFSTFIFRFIFDLSCILGNLFNNQNFSAYSCSLLDMFWDNSTATLKSSVLGKVVDDSYPMRIYAQNIKFHWYIDHFSLLQCQNVKTFKYKL